MVRQLVQNLDSTMLMKSCMWIDTLADKDTVKEQKFNRYRDDIQKAIVAKDPTKADKFSDWADIMKVLMRLRRHNRPRRCLFLPPWVFDAANINAQEHFRASWGISGPGIYPELPEGEQDGEGIIFSHNKFNYFQKRLFRFYRYWDQRFAFAKPSIASKKTWNTPQAISGPVSGTRTRPYSLHTTFSPFSVVCNWRWSQTMHGRPFSQRVARPRSFKTIHPLYPLLKKSWANFPVRRVFPSSSTLDDACKSAACWWKSMWPYTRQVIERSSSLSKMFGVGVITYSATCSGWFARMNGLKD